MAVAADVTVPSTPPARRRSRLAQVVGDAVLCLCLAKIWLYVAGVAAVDLGRVVCGDDHCSSLVSAAAVVVSVCDWFMLETIWAIAFLFLDRAGGSDPEVPFGRRLEAAGREAMPTFMLNMMSVGFFSLLAIAAVGNLLKANSPDRGSAMEMIGSALTVVGILGKDALSCFIIIPIGAVRLWRVTRPGWRCSAGADEMENP